jgi:hypothetical protein
MPSARVGYNDAVNRLKLGYYVLRCLGPGFVRRRVGLYARHKLGLDRRVFAPRDWEQIALADIVQPGTPTDSGPYAAWKMAGARPFLFAPGRPPRIPAALRVAEADRQPGLAERLRLLEEGRCVYFFRLTPAGPVKWNENPFDGGRAAPDRTWTDLRDYLPQQGDIRTLWEPARAAWAIDLARARAHGFELAAGALFWRWVDSWMAACPPFRGPQWKCGQEAAVRLLALTFGFWSLAEEAATTPERWQQFARLAWASGYRIANHISYAISQKNNHAVSEACGLMLVSYLFPEFRESQRWWRRGRRVLVNELRRQIYADGSYVQHSMNYQRVMLSMATVAFRLAELHGEPFERDLYELLGKAGDFLFQMSDPETGGVPNYGNNDGAHVLPLSECDFLDFRPVVQTVHYLVHRSRRLPAGPWDEDLLWLFGPEALASSTFDPAQPRSRAFPDGGYYTLRGEHSWTMMRCHTYRDRPAHYDQAHLDLWYQGQNVLSDCGTYRYYIPRRTDWESYFRSISAHNCVEIDGGMPVGLASRFQYFPWPRGSVRHYRTSGALPHCCVCEHYDYDRKPWHVLHRRTVVRLPRDGWAVVDDLLGAGAHRGTWFWHLLGCELTHEPNQPALVLKTPVGDFALAAESTAAPRRVEVIRGRDEPGCVQGFAAPYYGERLPIPVLEVEYESPLPLRVVTALGPIRTTATLLGNVGPMQCWAVAIGHELYELRLAPPDRASAEVLREFKLAPALAAAVKGDAE